MVGQLIGYIQQQLSGGYNLDQLRGSLLSQGYNKADVDADINSVIEQQANNLKPYIQGQLDSGQELHAIRKSLVDNHYDYRIVDSAMKGFKQGIFSKPKNNEQSLQSSSQQTSQPTQTSQDTAQDSQLKDYVKQSLAQGFTLENIQSTLLQQGYDSMSVNKVINSFHQSHFHIPKTTVFVLIIALLAIGVGYMFSSGELSLPTSDSSGSDRASARAMDLEIQDLKLQSEYLPGDDYRFKVAGINTGAERGYDISLSYYLEDSNGRRYGQKSEAIILDYTISEIIDYEIPSNIPSGRYTLWLIADYKDDVARASMEVAVGKVDELPPPEPSQPDVPSQKPTTSESNEPSSPSKQDYLGDGYEDDVKQEVKDDLTFVKWKQELTPDTISKIESQSLKDADYALFLCEELKASGGKDSCVRLIAETTKDRQYCLEIEDRTKEDICHMSFARESSDKDICDDIETSTVQSTCKMLVKSNQFREMYGLKTTVDVIKYLDENQRPSESNSETNSTSP
jgi:hypothetical protein